ncbi:HAMP domain-containing sensor histidine kinase [Chitinophaga sancti]|uniref:sensor histidine kinase n=1 Tax=Chitinophaga sancti TaxID=1004 RepID=UPI002A751EF8|nr:HAMP domain-containing sensor histidine kinase [Chitinophaga sancti]WPQ61352.1 HAMP domain-containing sensor histidine kinase [Chitinophaga sancti]
MKIYLFTAIEQAFKKDFYQQIRYQNIRVTGITATIVLFTTLITHILTLTLPASNSLPVGQQHQLIIIQRFLLISSAVIALAIYLIRSKLNKFQQNRYHFLVILFALCFIGSCMGLTFVSQHNPKNTMTMMLIGFLVIAMVQVFSFRQLITICLVTGTTFSLFFHLFQVNKVALVGNMIIFWLMMCAFLVVSRLLYSYHANYFIKIKTIEEKNEEIAAANKLKTEILGIVAHDLRSPISGIRSVLHLMQEYPFTPEQENKYLAWISEACGTADQIIEELLTAARQSDENKLQTNYISLNDWLVNVRDNWQQQVRHQQRVLLELPQGEIKAHIHTGKLQRVVDNLLHNALKFTPDGGDITLGMRPHRGGVRISVADTGIGIPEEMLPNIFDRFTSARRKGLHHEPSTGLGLHICKQLVQQHGGNIYVSSQENKGTVFNIDLPYTVL